MRATILFALTTFIISTSFVSCSSAPTGPASGTPAFYWQGAKETFAAKDYMKTLDNLDRAAKGPEFAPQAQASSLVIHAGLIRGYNELADEFEQGARANRNNPGAFRKITSDFRRSARPLTLQMAEKFMAFQRSKDEQVSLAFPFPVGSQNESPLQGKIEKGIMPQQSELEDTQRLALARALVLTASDAAGAGEDSSKAQEMFKSGDLKVPRVTFMTAMAHAFVTAAEVFGPKKLDEPDRANMFAQTAKDALKGAPDSKEIKALNEKIDKILKATKRTT